MNDANIDKSTSSEIHDGRNRVGLQYGRSGTQQHRCDQAVSSVMTSIAAEDL